MNSPLAFQIDKSRSLLSKDRLSSSSGGRIPNRSIIPVTSPPPTKAMIISQDSPSKVDHLTDNSSSSTTTNRLPSYNRITDDSAELAEKVWRDHHRKQQVESSTTSSTDANTPLSSSDKRYRNNPSTSDTYQKSSSRKIKTTRFQTRTSRKSANNDHNDVDMQLPDYQLPKVALPIDESAFPKFSFEAKLADNKAFSSTNQKVFATRLN